MTRTGGAAVAAALIVLLGTGIAGAQTPVQGGGSFNDAPVVPPGAYADTIRPSETLFYGIDLAAGQALAASAEIGGSGDLSFGNFTAIRLSLYSPARMEDVFAQDAQLFQGGRNRYVLRTEGDFVGLPGSGDAYTAAGTYFLALTMDAGGVPDQEYPVTLTVEVRESGAPSPTPTTAPTPTSSPAPSTPSPSERGDEGLGLVPLGGLSLLIGALAGALASALWRLRRTGK